MQNQSVTVCARLCTNTSAGVSTGTWASIGVEQSNVGKVTAVARSSIDDITAVVIAVVVCAVLDLLLMVTAFTAIGIKKCLERREE